MQRNLIAHRYNDISAHYFFAGTLSFLIGAAVAFGTDPSGKSTAYQAINYSLMYAMQGASIFFMSKFIKYNSLANAENQKTQSPEL
jgi:hypothetical protein